MAARLWHSENNENQTNFVQRASSDYAEITSTSDSQSIIQFNVRQSKATHYKRIY